MDGSYWKVCRHLGRRNTVDWKEGVSCQELQGFGWYMVNKQISNAYRFMLHCQVTGDIIFIKAFRAAKILITWTAVTRT